MLFEINPGSFSVCRAFGDNSFDRQEGKLQSRIDVIVISEVGIIIQIQKH